MVLGDEVHDSSSLSERDSDAEYEVEAIVAECIDENDGRPRYLVKWEGYSAVRNTWEPEENFLTAYTLDEWKEKKQKIAEGELPPFDLADWSRRVDQWREEAERKRQDREFRRRKEERREGVARLRSCHQEREPADQQRADSSASDGDDNLPDSPQRAKKRRLSLRSNIKSAPIRTPAGTSTGYGRPSAVGSASVPEKKSYDLSSLKPVYKSKLGPARAAKGAGPARSASTLKSNIFINWDASPSRRKRNTAPKPFKNLWHAFAVEKKGRTEPAPQLDRLQLFRASDGQGQSEPTPQLVNLQLLRANGVHRDRSQNLFLTPSPSPAPQSRQLSTSVQASASWAGQTNNDGEPVQRSQAEYRNGEFETEAATSLLRDEWDHSGKHLPLSSVVLLPRRQSLGPVPVYGTNTMHIEHIRSDPTRQYQEVKGHLLIHPSAFGGFRREENEPIRAKTSFFVRGKRPNPWWTLFLRIKEGPRQLHVHIEQLCTASDYLHNYHKDGQGYYSIGYIPDLKEWSSLFHAYKRAELVEGQRGGLFFSSFFMLLVYPPNRPDWAFLDDLFGSDPPSSELRFIMRSPVPSQPPEILTLKPSSLQDLPVTSTQNEELEVPKGDFSLTAEIEATQPPKHDTGSTPNLEVDNKDAVMADVDMPLDDLFEKYFGRKWSEIIPPLSSSSSLDPNCFFIYYPDEPELVREEHDFLKQLLQIGSQYEVYSSLAPGEWDFFAGKVSHGVILFHKSVKLEKVPMLARRILRNGNVGISQVELNHRDPDIPLFARNLFPSGGAFLLLDSVVLQDTKTVALLLRWFRHTKLKNMAVSKWKFVVRPGFREWIRKIIENEQNVYKADQLHAFKDILTELVYGVSADIWDPRDNFKTPRDLVESPIASPYLIPNYAHDIGTGVLDDLELLKSNDLNLVRWFGAWTLERIDMHRKFYILFNGYGGGRGETTSEGWAAAWQHINIVTPATFAEYERVQRDEETYRRSRLAKKSPKDNPGLHEASSSRNKTLHEKSA